MCYLVHIIEHVITDLGLGYYSNNCKSLSLYFGIKNLSEKSKINKQFTLFATCLLPAKAWNFCPLFSSILRPLLKLSSNLFGVFWTPLEPKTSFPDFTPPLPLVVDATLSSWIFRYPLSSLQVPHPSACLGSYLCFGGLRRTSKFGLLNRS